MSSKASLNLLPCVASILFRFFSENIIFLFSIHSAKYFFLPSFPVIFSKSESITSASQYLPGFTYPSLTFVSLESWLENCLYLVFLFIILFNFFTSFLDISGISKPASVHLCILIACSKVNDVPSTISVNFLVTSGKRLLNAL